MRREIPDKTLMLSQAFYAVAKSHVEQMLDRRFFLEIVWQENSFVAYTTSEKKIVINAASSIIQSYATQKQRIMSFYGVLNHEIAHQRFCDVFADGEQIATITSENIPEGMDNERFRAACQDEQLRPVICHILHTICNVIADARDETRISEEFPNSVAASISASTFSQWSSLCPYEQTAESSPINRFYGAILQLARFGDVYVYDDDYTDDVLEKALSCDEAVCTAKIAEQKERLRCYADIVAQMLDFIESEQQEQSGEGGGNQEQSEDNQDQSEGSREQSGEGESQSEDGQQQSEESNTQTGGNQKQSGGSPISTERIAEIMSEIEKVEKDFSQIVAENNLNAVQPQENSGNAKKSNATKSDLSLDAAIAGVLQDVSNQELEHEASQQIKKLLRVRSESSSHQNIQVRTQTYNDVIPSKSQKEKIAKILAALRPYASEANRRMKVALEAYMEDGVNRRQYNGKLFDGRDAYRIDGKCFANRKDPEDFPNIAISVLIDQSGSMAGEKIEVCRTAGVLLHQMCSELHVPCMICGHNTRGVGMNFFVYTTFQQIRNDVSSLAFLDSDGCNRDGLAIDMAARLLSSRPEQKKLLFVLSDGMPYHLNYGGEAAVKDIQEIVRKYRTKGVVTFGCAVDEDAEAIRDIYGDGYLDFTDLARMPRDLARIVKKYLDLE